MIALLLDRDLCEVMGERGRKLAEEQFAEDLYVDRFVARYQSLLSRCHG